MSAPSQQQLMSPQHRRDFAVIKPPASKSDPFGAHWGSKLIHLSFAEVDFLNAARNLRDLELDLVVSAQRRRDFPLLPMAAGKPFAAHVLDGLLKQMLQELVAVSLVSQQEAISYIGTPSEPLLLLPAGQLVTQCQRSSLL